MSSVRFVGCSSFRVRIPLLHLVPCLLDVLRRRRRILESYVWCHRQGRSPVRECNASCKRYWDPGKQGLRDCSWREGLCLRVLGDTEGNSIGEGRGLLAVGRGAAHSNTQGKGNESIDSLLGY